MLDEEQASANFEHASHFFQRSANLRNAAASPCHYDRIQTAVRQRDTLGRAFDEVDWIVEVLSVSLSPRQQPGRRIESEDFLGIPRIERKIEARPDPDVEHSAFGCARDALTIWTKSLVAHRQIDERRDNPFLMKPIALRPFVAVTIPRRSRVIARRVGQVQHRGSHRHYRSTALLS